MGFPYGWLIFVSLSPQHALARGDGEAARWLILIDLLSFVEVGVHEIPTVETHKGKTLLTEKPIEFFCRWWWWLEWTLQSFLHLG